MWLNHRINIAVCIAALSVLLINCSTPNFYLFDDNGEQINLSTVNVPDSITLCTISGLKSCWIRISEEILSLPMERGKEILDKSGFVCGKLYEKCTIHWSWFDKADSRGSPKAYMQYASIYFDWKQKRIVNVYTGRVGE